MDESSAELLERYRQGDARAAEALFARHVEHLTALIRQQLLPSLRRRLDADDVVQSAYRSFFIRARQGAFTLTHSGDLWKLLVTMALNKLRHQLAYHFAQKRSPRRECAWDAVAFTETLAHEPSPLQALATAEELTQRLRGLTPLQRRVLEMRLQEQSGAQIAAATGRSERTVRRILAEIRARWEAHCSPAPQPTLSPPATQQPSVQPQRAEAARSAASSPAPRYDDRDFRLLEHLGSGGMGKVYRAQHQSLDWCVAIKMLRKASWTAPAAVARFTAEAQTLALLQHPGIVRYHGLGRTRGGGWFIVMDFIAGGSLDTRVRQGPATIDQTRRWLLQAAAALAHAHQRGVIHCDLKPSNLLCRQDGQLLISDFGLATSVAAQPERRAWAGTLGYMAPEQLDPVFGAVSPATDLFALGLVAWTLLTGSPLLQERPISAVLASWRGGSAFLPAELRRRGVPQDLDEALAGCLAVSPAARWHSAEQLLAALQPPA